MERVSFMNFIIIILFLFDKKYLIIYKIILFFGYECFLLNWIKKK